MDRTIVLAVNSGEGKTRLLTANANKAVKVKLIQGNKYLLKNLGDDFAPENVTLARVGKELHVIQEGDTQPSIIIEDYFNGEENNPVLQGMAEDGQLYAYVPLSGEGYENGYLTGEGDLTPVALGGPSLGSGSGIFAASDDNHDALYGLLGWLAAAGAIGVGAAIANRDDDDNSDRTPPTKPSIGQILDNTGDITGPITNGSVTDETQPVLNGTGEPGDIITIYDNGQVIGSTVIDAEGNWTFTPEAPLEDGKHQLVITETDSSGNISAPSDPIEFGVDTIAPDAPAIQHIMDKVGDIVGEIKPDSFTDDSRPELSGIGEPGSKVTIYDNGVAIGETDVNVDGRWFFQPANVLADGLHEITISQTDPAGNQSGLSDGWSFTVDTSAPTKPNVDEILDKTGDQTGPLKGGDTTDEKQPEFNGKGEPGSTIIIEDNGVPIGSVVVDEEGNWSFKPEQPLDDGDHSLVIIEEDKAGNRSEPSDPIDIVVDTVPPAKPENTEVLDKTGDQTGPLKGGDATDEKQPEFNGKGEPGNTIIIEDNGTPIGSAVVDEEGNWSFKPEQPLDDGDHSLVIIEEDKAGNRSEPSDPIDIVIDTIAPEKPENIEVLDKTGDQTGPLKGGDTTDEKQPEFNGKGEPGNTIIIEDNGTPIGTVVVDEEGNWTFKPEQPLDDGDHSLVIVEEDKAGNRSEPSDPINIVIDTIAPEKPENTEVLDKTGDQTGPLKGGDTTDEKQPEFNGKGEPGNTIIIEDNGTPIGTVVVDEEGNWTFKPEQPLDDGDHSLVIIEEDKAGNRSEPSDPIDIVIDTIAPEKPENIEVLDKTGDQTGPLKGGDTTDEKQPEFNGKGEPGNTIIIEDNGVPIGTVVVDEEGNWTFKPEQPLDDGDHSLVIIEEDKAGNRSEPSDPINIVIDTIAPEKPENIEVLDKTGDQTGPLKGGDTTDEKQPEFNGKGEPGNTIIIEDNGVPIGTVVVDEEGNWTFKPEQPLDDGDHSLVIIEEDKAGNRSEPSDPIDIVVDTIAPEKPSIGVAIDDVGDKRGELHSGDVTDDKAPTFKGEAEPNSVINIYDDGNLIGSVQANEHGAWSFTPENELDEGAHSITTTATDEAGNTSESSDVFEIVVDTIPSPSDPDHLAITGVKDQVGDVQGNIASGSVTDDSQPVISGIGTAGDTIFVYTEDKAGNHLIGSAKVLADGTWSMQPTTPLLEGDNKLTIVAQDAAGNKTTPSTPSYDIEIDITVPQIPAITSVTDDAEPHVGPLQPGEVTNDNTPTLSGSAEANSTVIIYSNGKAIGSAVADAKGEWTFTPETALGDGSNKLYITATDAAGGVSAPSGSFEIVIDTVKPESATDIVINDNVGEKTGAVAPGETTDDRSPTMTGKGEPGSTVSVIDNGEVIGTTTVKADGSWEFTPAKPLDDGNHELSTIVTDTAGNSSEPSPGVVIVVDSTPVVVDLGEVKDNVGPNTGSLQPGDVTDDTRPEFNGKGKPGSTVTVKDGDTVLGTTIVKPDGSWSFTPETDLTDGTHSLTVTAEDAAGNTTTTPAFEFSVDSEAPEKPSIGSATDNVGDVRGDLISGSVTDDANPAFNGEAEPNSVINIYDNGTLIGSVQADEHGAWSFTPTTPLVEGEHSITTTATDKAGNTSEMSDAFELVTDYSPSPSDPDHLAITGVKDQVGDVQGNIASGSVTDDSQPVISGIGTAGDTIFVYTEDKAGNHLIGSAKVLADGTWSMQPTTPLLEGDNKLTIVAQDAAGNKTTPSTPSYDIEIDITVPQIPAITSVTDDAEPHVGPLQPGGMTNDNTPTLSGSAEANSTVIIYSNGKAIGSAVADAKGEWTFTPETALGDGSNKLYITATDAAGGVSAPSGSFEIVIDTVKPESATDIVINDNVGEKTGAVAPGETTDDRSPTMTGKGEPGSTVSVIDNGEVIGTTTVKADGSWEFTPAKPLDDGNHELSTIVTDTAGNSSEPSPGVVIVVDSTPVVVDLGEVKDNVGPNTGSLQPGDVTDDTRPEFNGKGKPGSTVTVKDGDTVLGTTIVKPDGSWSFTPETDLTDGTHSLTVTAEDAAGNTTTTPAFEFSVDSEAPEKPSIGSATDNVGDVRGDLISGSVTDDANPAFNGEAEPNSVINIYDNGTLIGSVQADEHGAWSFTPTTPLVEGEHSITTTATDKAGNTSEMSDAFELVTDYSPSPSDPDHLAITAVKDQVGDVQGNIASGSVTDDSQPVISGIGTAGDTIFVYTEDKAGNHLIGSATVLANGTWSMQPTTPLLEGDNKLTIVAQDAAGNKTTPSTPSYDIEIDITVPQIPAITSVTDDAEPHVGPLQPGGMTNDNTPTLSGSAEANSTVIIYSNGKAIGSTVATAKGEWTFTPETALGDGSNKLYITATDAAGGVSAPSGSFEIVIDTAKPESATDIVINDNVGEKTGAVAPGETTDDRSPTMTGKGEPGSTVSVIDNGEVIGTTTVKADGSWEFTPAKPLDDGNHELSTIVTDTAGNSSEPSPGVVIVVDSTPVVVDLGEVKDNVGPNTGSLQPGDVTDDTRPEFNGKGKPGSTVTVKDGDTVLGTTIVKPDGSWSFTPETDLTDGTHSLTVTAEDAAGNTTTTPAFEFSVDSEAPEKPSIGSATDNVGDVRGDLISGSVTDDANPTFNGEAEPNSVINIYDNGTLIGSVQADEHGAWSFTPTTPLVEGEHSITTTATDKAGNTSEMSDAFELVTDYTPPNPDLVKITGVEDAAGKVTGNVAAGGETDDSRPTIHGTGAEAGNIITVSDGNKVIGTAIVLEDGTWSMQPTLPLQNGAHTLTATEADMSGNAATSPEYDFVVRVDPPLPPVIERVEDNVGPILNDTLQKGEVTDDNTPTLHGSATPNGIVTVYDNGKPIGSTQVDDKGAWTFTPTTPLIDGPHNLTANVTDSIGRTSDATGDYRIVVDTTAPDAVIDLVVHDDFGPVTGNLKSGDITDDNTPTFSGKAEAGSVVTVYDNGEAIGSVKVEDNGTWKFTPSTPLDNGAHDFTTTVTDVAGNTSADSEHLAVTVDKGTEVQVEITALKDDVGSITENIKQDGFTDDTRPEVVGTAKAGSIVTVYDGDNVLGSTTAKADGSWSFTPTGDLGQGIHNIHAKAVDPVGNQSESGLWKFIIDTVAPLTPTIVSAADDVGSVQSDKLTSGSETDDPTPTLSGTAEANSVVHVYDQNGLLGSVKANASGDWSFTTPVLAQGEHHFTVTATDVAGNVSGKSNIFDLTMDFTPPDASLVKITGVEDAAGKVTGNVAAGGETDDNRPTIHGTGAEAGNIITVSNGTKVIGSAIVQEDGTWSMQPILPLQNGLHTLTATESDKSGNTATSPEYEINVVFEGILPPVILSVEDNVGPHLSDNLQKGDVTDDNTPTLHGTAVAGGIVIVYDNDKAIGSTQVEANGSWTFTPELPLKDGNHNLTADVTDSLGRTSVKTGDYNIVVDTTAPDAVTGLVVHDDFGPVTGNLKSGDTTDDNTPTFSGKAEAGSVVTVYDNGEAIGSVKVEDSGLWKFTPSTPLDNGAHDFTTKVTDVAGNTSAEGEHMAVTVDKGTEVQVEITALKDDVGGITENIKQDGFTDDTRPEVVGTAKAGSIVTVYDGDNALGSTKADGNGNWSFTPTGDLGQGVHSLSAKAVDPVGNPSESGKWTFTVDTVAPLTPTIVSAADDVGGVQSDKLTSGSETDDPTPTLSGRAEANSVVHVYDQSGLLGSVKANASGDWSFTTPTLPEGEHHFTVTATDAAGNVSDRSNIFDLTMDFTPPDASLVKITGVEDAVGKAQGNIEAGGVTDDSRPTIHGTGAEVGNIITVSDGTKVIGSAIVRADGTWSMQPTLPMLDGTYALTATESDKSGNAVTSPEYGIRIDTESPQPPVIVSIEDNVGPHLSDNLQKGEVTDDNTPTLHGTAVAGGIVTVYDNGTAIGSVQVSDTGSWTFTPTTPLIDGSHNLTANVIDSIGRTSDATGDYRIVVDTTVPDAVTGLVVHDDFGPVTGNLKSGDTTDDNTPTFSGKAEAGSVVTVYDNGEAIGSVKVEDNNGSWKFTPSTPLDNGAHDFTTKVTDVAGNTSAEGEHMVINVDLEPGMVTITSLKDDVGGITGDIKQDSITDDTRPEVVGKAKAGSIVTVYDGSSALGSTQADGDGNWSFTPSGDLGQGVHSLSAKAVDPAGNPSESGKWTFTVDTVPPITPTIVSAADDVGSVQSDKLTSGSETDDPTPTLSGTAEANSVVLVYDQNGLLGSVKATASGDWSFTTPVLAQGEHHFTVTATDAAGNVSGKSNIFDLTMDFTPPDASLVKITGVEDAAGKVTGNVEAGGVTDDNRPTIHGTGAEAGNIITVSNGTKVIGSAIVLEDGSWSMQPTLPILDGTYALTATESDKSGNTATSPEYGITIDTGRLLPPVIVSIEDNVGPHLSDNLQKGDVTDDNTPTLHGTAVANGIVTVYDNGTAIGSVQVSDTGSWTFTPTTPLNDGSHNLTANVTDTLGRTSDATGDYNIVVDTTAPDAVTGLVVYDDFGPVTSNLKSGDTTDDNTPTFSGKAEAGSVVTVYDNGEAIGSVKVEDSGSWKFTPSTPLDNGAHDFTTKVTDVAGNTSAEGEHMAVTVDKGTEVQVEITALKDDVGGITENIKQDGFTDDTRPEVVGTAKAGSIVTVYDGDNALGSTKADGNGNWSFTPSSDLGQGAHSLSAKAVDPVGNPSESGKWNFTIDTTAPNIPFIDEAADDVGSVQPQHMPSGSATDDPTPTLSGRAEANSVVHVYDQSGLLGSVKASSTGLWSFTTPVLTEGEHRFTVTATDTAGNVSDPSASFILTMDFTPPDPSLIAITDVIDNFGPVTGSVASNGVLDDRQPVIIGKGAEVGDIITVSTTDADGNTKVLGSTTVKADGTWELTPTGSLYNGSNKLTVTETDLVGNVASPNADYVVTIMQASGAPSITGVVDDAGESNINLSEGALTKDNTPTLQGSSAAAQGDIITIYNGTTVVGTTTAGANGEWSFTPDRTLVDGVYNFTVTSTNSAGQVSEPSNGWAITIDTTPPSVITDMVITDDVGDITGPIHNNDRTDDNKPTFSGHAEAGSLVTIYDNGVAIGSTIVENNDEWKWEPTAAMADGDYKFTTTVTDLTGNQSAHSTAVNVTIDTQAPEVSLAIEGYYDDVGTNKGLILGSGSATDDTSPVLKGTWSGDLLPTDTIRIYQNGVLLGMAVIDSVNHSWSYALSGLLNTNTYTYTATAVDVAGNETAISPEFSLTIDLDAPTQTVNITSYTDDVGLETGNFGNGTSTDDRNPTLNGKVNGAALDEGDVVRIYDAANNQLLGSTTVDGEGNWSFVLPSLNDDTTYTFRAVVADSAGNEGPVSNNFTMTIDLTVIVNSQNTLDTTPIVTGNTGFEIQSGEYLEVTINGKTYSSQNGQVVVDPRNNTWYVEVPDADVLAKNRTYEVTAVLKSADGTVITQDDTTGELFIAGTPDAPETPKTNDTANKATAMTIGENGQWRIFSNMAVLDADGSDVTDVTSLGKVHTLTGNEGVFGSVTFIDFNRNGLMDLTGQDSAYWDGNQAFEYRPGYTQTNIAGVGTAGKTNDDYYAFQIGSSTYYPDRIDHSGSGLTSANTWSWYGGTAAYDKTGDGYVDLIFGDNTPNDESAAGHGYNTSFVENADGQFQKDPSLVFDTLYGTAATAKQSNQSTPEKMVSTVDLNNDGVVDLVYLAGATGFNYLSDHLNTQRTYNNNRLVVASHNGDGVLKVNQIVEDMLYNDEGLTFDGVSMTWADFDGDGYLDLFQGTTGSIATPTQNASKIYFNDGGRISSGATNATTGIETGAGRTYNMGDNMKGGGSVAVDWNADGKMDIIETPYFPAGANPGVTGSQQVLMFTNNTANGTVNFTQSTVATVANQGIGSAITGLLTLDLDWDGDKDLLLFTGNRGSTYVENKTQIADGTSIHLKILDQEGINALFGNTVQLYNSKGELVATQILNPQAGNQTNDSSALVDFYGLDAAETYTAVLLRNVKGVSSNVGGVVNVGGVTAENVNAGWTGLKANHAYDSYVLTAEGGNAVNNANIGNGIVGTGYNDTFIATLGTDIYNGGGGTTIVSGERVWSNTGGVDIVDYKLATSAINVDLSKTTAQDTGFGTATFVNIEGIAGTSGNDTFTGNAANNYFEGRGGNDTFNLANGGQDTLIYRALDGSNNGGNGQDTVNGFFVGTKEATPNADVIDVSDLLIGYRADADGPAHYINGVATIDSGETIGQYLSITYNGNDSILNIDRDGSGSAYSTTALLTFTNTRVDLPTLLANHQLVIDNGKIVVNPTSTLMIHENNGFDIVDYSEAVAPVTANLWTGSTNGSSENLNSVEGLIGSQYGDTFTDNSADNMFEGRGGNDTFYLVNGGNDTLMYKPLEGMENDATGGNGHDTVHGFHVGDVTMDNDADLIDLSAMLDYDGPISFFDNNGKMELDESSQGIFDYLKVETVGRDTVISIDRDGQGGQYASTSVITLADVHTDLQTLLQNNQIIL